MNLDDFRCMRRGVQLAALHPEEKTLLAPINQRNHKRQTALLLLHGYSSSPAVYRKMMHHLPPYDATVVPVLPGHGNNLEAFAQTPAEEWLRAVELAYEQLAHEYEQVDVMGLSLGGVLACHLANQFSLHHLYLLAPALNLHLPLNSTLKLVQTLRFLGFSAVRSAAGNLLTDDSCEIAYRQLPLASIMQILSFIRDFSFKVPACPTDVFLGRHDAVVNSKAVAERFQHDSRVRIHWLDHSAHVLPLDGDIDQIITCMQKV